MNMIIARDFVIQSKVLLLFAFASFFGVYTFEYSIKVEYSSDVALEGVLFQSLINEVLRMIAFILFGGLIAKRALNNLADVSFFSVLWSVAKSMIAFMFTMIAVLLVVGMASPELQPGQELKDLVISNFQYSLLFFGLVVVVSSAIVSFVQYSYNAGVRKNCKMAKIPAKSFPLYKNEYLIPFRAILMILEQPIAILLGSLYIALSALTVYLSRENIVFVTVIINALKMTMLMAGSGIMIRQLIQRAVSFKEKEASLIE